MKKEIYELCDKELMDKFWGLLKYGFIKEYQCDLDEAREALIECEKIRYEILKRMEMRNIERPINFI